MGYRIVYGGPSPESKIQNSTAIRLRTMVAAAFLMLCMAVRLLWPDGTAVLRSVFLPSDLTVTEEAFSVLIEEVRQGQPLGDSITAFCHKILDEAAEY